MTGIRRLRTGFLVFAALTALAVPAAAAFFLQDFAVLLQVRGDRNPR